MAIHQPPAFLPQGGLHSPGHRELLHRQSLSPRLSTLDESDASLLSFLASLRGTSSTGVFAPLLPSFPARSLLLCTDSQPSPAKLALLQAAALTTTQVTQVTTQPTSLATDKVSVKREAARRRKVAEESARLPIPVLDEVNDIAMELISSGSDSYVESSSDEPEPVFESTRRRAV